MIRQIREILLTYVRRTFSGVLPVILLLMPLVAVLQLLFGPLRLVSTGLLFFYFPGLVAVHLKQQAIHVRERRLPSALYLHLGIGVGFVLLLALGLPMARMSITHQWSVGFPGLMLAGTAVTFAMIMVGSAAFGILMVPLVWIGLVPSAQQWIADLCTGQHEEAGIALVACGLAGIWASVAYLRDLTEEDRAYHWRADAASQGAYQRMTGQRLQAAQGYRKGRWFNPPDPSDAAVANWPIWARGSFWQRARLWAVATRLPIGTIATMFLFPIFVVAPAWLSGRPVNFQQQLGPLFYVVFANIPVTAHWFQRRPSWTSEFVRPVARQEFILVQLVSLGRSMAQATTILIAGWLAFMAVLLPATLLASTTSEIVAATIVAQFFMFSCCTWLLRYRTRAGVGLLMFPTMIFTMILSAAMITGRASLDPVTDAVWCCIAVAASALVLWDANRRWMKTELD